MIANTYVVKPFGISEVKVIALKGEPGGPTQEQVNAAVEEYMDDHPEAQIPDGSVSMSKLSSDVAENVADVPNKANSTGYYPDLIAGTADNLLSSSYQTDKTPYILRRTPYGAREKGSIVGGSLVWNQLCNNASVTVANGHKYLLEKDDAYSIGASTGTALTGLTVGSDMVFDLTLMFGPTVADYLYTQEQASAGAGVALAKAWAGITADYYPYDAGSIKSVTGLTAHRMTDGNGDVIGEYPLDSSLTLRGIPKLDGDSIYYDGDIYPPSGEVERKYYLMDMGVLNWKKSSSGNNYYANLGDGGGLYPKYAIGNAVGMMCARYIVAGPRGASPFYGGDKEITYYYRATAQNPECEIYVHDESYTNVESFKSAMSGVYLVYELAEPTTEQAEPYTELQACDPNGTEEWVGASMPVGHNTKYMRDLKKLLEGIPDAPSANGTYVLKATVSASGVTYAWIAG